MRLAVAIVGGGPAGVLAAAAAASSNAISKIFWFDDSNFKAGQLRHFPHIPSNTKLDHLDSNLCFFSDPPLGPLANRYESVSQSIDQIRLNAIPFSDDDIDPCVFRGFPRMSDMTQFFVAVSKVIGALPHVDRVFDTVDTMHLVNQTERKWQIHTAGKNRSFHADFCVLCPGSSKAKRLESLQKYLNEAVEGAHVPQLISAEIGLDKMLLLEYIKQYDYMPKVALVGNSHTALLVLKNLVELNLQEGGCCRPSLFRRREERYAKWLGTSYQYNSTGLKGVAASFAMSEIGQAFLNGPGCFSMDEFHPGEFDVVIPCIGFEPSPLPSISMNTEGNGLVHLNGRLEYDSEWGMLALPGDKSNKDLGLYEIGASRPEYYTDMPIGHPQVSYDSNLPETEQTGWKDEHIVGWSYFRTRALRVVDNIVNKSYEEREVEDTGLYCPQRHLRLEETAESAAGRRRFRLSLTPYFLDKIGDVTDLIADSSFVGRNIDATQSLGVEIKWEGYTRTAADELYHAVWSNTDAIEQLCLPFPCIVNKYNVSAGDECGWLVEVEIDTNVVDAETWLFSASAYQRYCDESFLA